MGKLIIWLVHHPDVKVRFNYDEILDCLRIRVIKGRFISEHLIDPLLEPSFNDDHEKFGIDVLNDLYDRLEKEKKKYDNKYL